jgi:uncharacterized protein YutE (UPF0331/DUF86 family)
MAKAVAQANATKKRLTKAYAKVKKAIISSIIDRRFALMPLFATIRVF